jgi:hypothetical protein
MDYTPMDEIYIVFEKRFDAVGVETVSIKALYYSFDRAKRESEYLNTTQGNDRRFFFMDAFAISDYKETIKEITHA